ncbi:hypothetical protein Pst134EA_019251 [Puccinia striiformis f. sp. tritici]|uniref:hypothetical protein n=1 Tax=Puccinia striiformis f. sp. tritici TaxID=168172 RepID=UPI002007775E|nr:hypothetical protein Pst134EA_019251 [Puccinia striiformis f. sp. tritici]KAH9459100.1 hypothetical protein Pst134EA_019251 [Puccinia striiformis f. sp. tritici]
MHRRLKTKLTIPNQATLDLLTNKNRKAWIQMETEAPAPGGTGSGGTALGGTQTGTSNGQQEEKSLDQTPSDKTPSPGEQLESTDNQAKPGEALKTDSQTDNTKPGDTGSANGQTGGGVQEQKSLDTSGQATDREPRLVRIRRMPQKKRRPSTRMAQKTIVPLMATKKTPNLQTPNPPPPPPTHHP